MEPIDNVFRQHSQGNSDKFFRKGKRFDKFGQPRIFGPFHKAERNLLYNKFAAAQGGAHRSALRLAAAPRDGALQPRLKADTTSTRARLRRHAWR
ncbi:hypothetical protein E5Z46_01100 [Geobacillus kaustophilus NBRC 102445]|nr:hypothetical protein E5Z46_01100 [Geobacillus kaustophilus NBRC 102445]